MIDPSEGGIPLRCYCRERPLLAMCGRDHKTGEPWVHVKSWKGDKLYVEIVVNSGVVRLRCRACMRWHRVKIVRGAPKLREDKDFPSDAGIPA